MSQAARRRFRLAATIAVPLLALLTLMSWSLSSAVASSPDDDFHLASIWCGLGERPGLCEAPQNDPGSLERYIPASIPKATCYAFKDERSAHCWNPDRPGMTLVKRANVDHLYPPVFYAVMAPFATKNVTISVIAMRFVNSALTVGALTAVFFALPRRLRPALLISVIASSVPLGLFLFASTNPSSWAILSAAIVWICCYGALTTQGRQRYVLSGLAVFGAVLGGGARADAAIFAVFAIVLVLILGLRNWREQRSALIGMAAVVVISVLFYVTAGQSDATVSGLNGNLPPLSLSQNFENVLDAPSLWVGALGSWGLGWLDTVMPPAVWTLTTAVFAGAVFMGLRKGSTRKLIVVLGAFAAIWVVPVTMLFLSHASVGAQVQPRYILPLMVILLGVASAPNEGEHPEGGHHLTVGVVMLGATAMVALNLNIRRYTTGFDVHGIDPGSHAEWWWAVGPSPLAVWLIGSFTFGSMLMLLWWFTLRRNAPALRTRDLRPAVRLVS